MGHTPHVSPSLSTLLLLLQWIYERLMLLRLAYKFKSPEIKTSTFLHCRWRLLQRKEIMTLPVSSYEELLVRVRSLTHETIQLRRELSSSLSAPSDDPQALPGYATHPQRSVDQRRMTSNDGVSNLF